MTDQQAIDYLKQGNERERKQALSYILNKFSSMYYALLNEMGIHYDEVNILHESIVALYQNIHQEKFTLESKLTTYLHSVCKNMALAYLRKRDAQRKITDIDEVTEEVIRKMGGSNAPEPLESSHNDGERDYRIREEIQKLGSPCKEILFAYYFHKIKLKDLAKEMGYASENTMKQKRYKCLNRLKKQSKHLFAA